jgi:hypothetical protein
VAGLILALAILYISLAFYFYNDSSNPGYLGIGGIFLVASVVNVPLLYGIVGTWNIIFLSFPKRAPDDDETPTFRTWIGKRVLKMKWEEVRNHLLECGNGWREFGESCRSGEFRTATVAYWNIISTSSLFRPDWERLYSYIFAFILLEFGAFFVFFELSIVEMVKAPTKCS